MTEEQLEKAGFDLLFDKWPGWRKRLFWKGIDGFLLVNLISAHYKVSSKYGYKVLALPKNITAEMLVDQAHGILYEIFIHYCKSVGNPTEIIINAHLT